MDKELLNECLASGMSLPAIGELTGKHPSTVGYWVARHGLVANGRERYAGRGGLTREQLEPLASEGLSLREISERLDRSPSTVQHWLRRHGLRTERGRRQLVPAADRPATVQGRCRVHGQTTLVRSGSSGHYRCGLCRSDRVKDRRRRIKAILVGEAGGCCVLCGYGRCVSALHFHHLDPEAKEFHLALGGMTRSLQRSRGEAAKCVLLCANCHAEVEAGVTSVPLR